MATKTTIDFTKICTESVHFRSSAFTFMEEVHRHLREAGIIFSPYSQKVKISDITSGYKFSIISEGKQTDKMLEIHVNKYGKIFFIIYFLNPITGMWEELRRDATFIEFELFGKEFPKIIEEIK